MNAWHWLALVTLYLLFDVIILLANSLFNEAIVWRVGPPRIVPHNKWIARVVRVLAFPLFLLRSVVRFSLAWFGRQLTGPTCCQLYSRGDTSDGNKR